VRNEFHAGGISGIAGVPHCFGRCEETAMTAVCVVLLVCCLIALVVVMKDVEAIRHDVHEYVQAEYVDED
jgi:hypothetical protein